MTVKRKSRTAKPTRKNVLRFAPNFTAYLLPPNVVCLYSENRKFFLHGDLYCAVANVIGKNGTTAPEIVRQLSKSFSVPEIEEAIRRLLERRYVISGAPHAYAGAVDGYWASLGLPPEVAEENLRNWPVRVESIDVKGARELSAALDKLGVHIAKRAPRLVVTLVNDYLEPRLAERNGERVTAGTPWLLVQPSGVFPLVGPVFKPGESACWTCLHDRMIRNREIKGFLDRRAARALAISPLVSDAVGETAIHFAAVEIAKAIASGFRTDLSDHIASFDMTGAAIAKHYVAKRPQCSTCGSKKLRNPRRAAVPIELAEGRKLIMTSGGYRTVTSRATVARFRKHVSPLTGVVSRLERIEADLPMNTNFFCAPQFLCAGLERRSAQVRPERRQLRQGLHGRAGRGQCADGGDRALFGHLPGRRDQDDAPLCRFCYR
ncbi:bacteriocin biosynthesis cyclodehydratase domain-containing protein [Bradyrhizobium sp. USDA 4449]